jgi:iron complex transport system ATP-binding protein
MKEPLIEIEGFSFAIGGKPILTDISFSVQAGDALSIIGPNGAGKSTLLKCLDRIHRGGAGQIRIAGKALKDYSQRELAHCISYVPQSDGRSAPFTVHEFVMMGRYPHLSPFSSISKHDEEVVQDALRMTETLPFAERMLSTLSGGERQSVFIAAALAQEARVLLLDEPTTFLDPKHAAAIQRLLADINRERGVTILSVTHDINSAALSSERILALKNGCVAFCGSSEALMREDVLRQVYDKSFLLVPHPEADKQMVVPEIP